MRLIDADLLLEILDDEYRETDNVVKKLIIICNKQILSDAPTVDAEPVQHGHWECVDAPVFGNPYGSYKCDYCGNSMPHKTNYCPSCGADMRGEQNELDIRRSYQ